MLWSLRVRRGQADAEVRGQADGARVQAAFGLWDLCRLSADPFRHAFARAGATYLTGCTQAASVLT